QRGSDARTLSEVRADRAVRVGVGAGGGVESGRGTAVRRRSAPASRGSVARRSAAATGSAGPSGAATRGVTSGDAVARRRRGNLGRGSVAAVALAGSEGCARRGTSIAPARAEHPSRALARRAFRRDRHCRSRRQSRSRAGGRSGQPPLPRFARRCVHAADASAARCLCGSRPRRRLGDARSRQRRADDSPRVSGARAPRFDDYWSSAEAEWWGYLKRYSADLDPAAKAEAASTWASERDPEWTTALRVLCVDPGGTNAKMRVACARLGTAMAERAAT